MLKGKCHCGAVSWTLKDLPESATPCNCTICSRYGVLWAYGYINVDICSFGKTKVYQRSDGADIDFHFCENCGCVTHYIRRTAGDDGRYRTAVNLRMSDRALVSDLPIVRFDGQDTMKDLPQDESRVGDMWF